MKTRVKAEARLAENSSVELSLVAGKLVVEVASEAPTLSELLQGVTEANLHSEWKTGPAVGKEIW